MAVYNKLPLRDQATVGAYRQQIVERLFVGMLNRRLSELTQKPDAPFLAAGSGRGLFVRTKEAATLNAIVKEDGIERGLDASVHRGRAGGAVRVHRDRTRPPEAGHAARPWSALFAEKDKQESASLAAEYVRNFTQGEPIPGHRRTSTSSTSASCPEITLAEVNALGQSMVRRGRPEPRRGRERAEEGRRSRCPTGRRSRP